MDLRPNQIEPVLRGVEFFFEKKPDPSIIIAPTAFGKSIVIAHITKSVGEKMLIIQPTKELLEQNYNKYIALGGEASIFSASMKEKEIGDVTYVTIGSIIKQTQLVKKLGITKVIIDECDRFPREPSGMLRKFLKGANIKHILGLTATPLKLQTNMDEHGSPFSKLVMLTNRSKKGNFFKKIIHVAQIKDMVSLEYWSPLEYQSYDFDSGELVYNSTKADYTDDSIKKAYKNQNIGEKIIKKIHELEDRKAILVAVPTIDAARELSKKIANCDALYSGMPVKERNRIVDDFKAGKLRVVIQVSILSVGFDYPQLDCIITGRPTQSLSWWYQFVGRVTRIHPDKVNGLVVDFVGSVPKFGKVEDLYFKEVGTMWQLFGEEGKLLTGIPLHEIGHHIDGVDNTEFLNAGMDVAMPFGKYQGQPVRRIPSWYRNWLLTNIQWRGDQKVIKTELERLRDLGL